MPCILVVDDEHHILEIVRKALEPAGHQVTTTDSGRKALALLRERRFDLAILDLAMPDMDGLELCRKMRSNPAWSGLAILLLSAKAALEDKVLGFEAGADDYLVKPFYVMELRLRVRALLRRHTDAAPAERLQAGALALNPATFQVCAGERVALLTPMEYQLLHHLMSHCGEVFSSDRLLREVWEYPEGSGNAGLVRMHIKNLRRKIEPRPDAPTYLRTVPRHGYTIAASG